jgi:hypothetical protein
MACPYAEQTKDRGVGLVEDKHTHDCASRGHSHGPKCSPSFDNTAGFKLADIILSRDADDAPAELKGPPPRRLELAEELGHKHGVSAPLLIVLIAVLGVFGYLCFMTYSTYGELPLSSIGLILAGIGLFAAAMFMRSPDGCDCRWQQRLVTTGQAVLGQITEKHAAKQDDGKWQYEVDYAFQPKDSEESHWGRMRLNEQQFNSLHEGDDVTVLYVARKKDFVSRLYKFCSFRAVSQG